MSIALDHDVLLTTYIPFVTGSDCFQTNILSPKLDEYPSIVNVPDNDMFDVVAAIHGSL
jgi:hypothetical protein